MSKIEGTGPGSSPKDIIAYKNECDRAANLFQQALEERQKARDNPNKQAEMDKIMSQAKDIMQQTIHALRKSELEEREKKLMNDYAAFQKEPSDAKTQVLKEDISDIQNTLKSE